MIAEAFPSIQFQLGCLPAGNETESKIEKRLEKYHYASTQAGGRMLLHH